MPEDMTPNSTKAPFTMKIVLVVDGRRQTAYAIDFIAARLVRSVSSVDMVLCSVEPGLRDWQLRPRLRDEIAHRHRQIAESAISTAGKMLTRLGFQYVSRIESGEFAGAVTRCAKEENADLIVISERPRPPFPKRLGLFMAASTGGDVDRLLVESSVPVLTIPLVPTGEARTNEGNDAAVTQGAADNIIKLSTTRGRRTTR